ncbi:MAG TPA: hypothetical protein VLQ80_04935 [Candidatus Saccharimonadia bacterium]|nr:hypothetical protein [Candidatus Saccharimonadia bacterium]
MKWTTLAVVKDTPHRRTIPPHDLSHLVLPSRFLSRGPTRRLKEALRSGPAEVARRTGRSRRRCGWVGTRRLLCLGTLVWGCRRRCRGLTALLEHAPCDGAQPPHLAAHLDLRATVHGEHGLGHIPQKVVGAVAVRCAGTLAGNRRDDGILLVRHPHPHRLVQALAPRTGSDAQPAHLLRRTREPGLRTPDRLPRERAHHVPRLMALVWLPSIARQHQRCDSPGGLSEPCRVVLPGRQHGLVPATIVRDGSIGPLDLVRVLSVCTQLGSRPVAGKAALAEPAHHLPPQTPAWHADGPGGCGAAGPPPTRARGLRTAHEAVDYLRRPLQRLEMIAVVAHVHVAGTDRARTILDIHINPFEGRPRGPTISHGRSILVLK